MTTSHRWILISLFSFLLAACGRSGEEASFAGGAATLKVPSGFRIAHSEKQNGIAVATTSPPLVEVRFVYQSLREQAKINPGIAKTFLNGYAGTFGAERLSIGGPSVGAFIQAPASVGSAEDPGYESFGAVAFPEALVTFRLAARGAKGAEAILEFKASALPSLLAGLRAAGA